MPTVSVIVPNYNHANFLRERLDSILNQTYQDFELILLDDCSTDASVEVLSEYATHASVTHFVVNDQNSGSPFAQWELGVSLARGEFIWIAESDDVAEPAFLAQMVPLLSVRKNVVLAYCRSEVIDHAGKRKGDVPWCVSMPDVNLTSDYETRGVDEIQRRLAFYDSIPNTSAVLLRRAALSRIQLPVGMICCGDWITWIRILRLGDVVYLSRQLNLYRSHLGASTRAPQTRERAMKTIMEFGLAAQEAELPIYFQILRIKRYSMLCNVWCRAFVNYPGMRAAASKLPVVLLVMIYTKFAWRFTWNWIRMNRLSRTVRYHYQKVFPDKD